MIRFDYLITVMTQNIKIPDNKASFFRIRLLLSSSEANALGVLSIAIGATLIPRSAAVCCLSRQLYGLKDKHQVGKRDALIFSRLCGQSTELSRMGQARYHSKSPMSSTVCHNATKRGCDVM